MKKILLIAPNQPQINSIPEIRSITEMHRTYVLNGNLTLKEIYDSVRRSEYDIIHVATHTVEDNHFDKFPINDTEVLTIDDLVQIGKLSKTKLFFFNSCHSARSAYYIIKRLRVAAIYTTVNVLDDDAWKVPLSFYQVLADSEKDGKNLPFQVIFDNIDDESGNYGIIVAPTVENDIIVNLSRTVDALSASLAALQLVVDKLNRTVEDNAIKLDIYVKNSKQFQIATESPPITPRQMIMIFMIVFLVALGAAYGLFTAISK